MEEQSKPIKNSLIQQKDRIKIRENIREAKKVKEVKY